MRNIIRIALMILLAQSIVLAAGDSINYDESKVPDYTLPELLTTLDGESVTDADTWINKRRPEILELFRTHVFGRSPGRPADMTFDLVEKENVFDGRAVRKHVKVCFTKRSDGPCMNIYMYQPVADHPVPVFLGLKIFDYTLDFPVPCDPLYEQKGGMWKYAVDSGEDSSRPEKKIGPLPGKKLAYEILKRGYAFATIPPEDLSPDDPKTYTDGVIGEFSDPGARAPDDWGTIGAWAWGLSRALDYFETDPDIDHEKVAVMGHSRRGKTALWAAARDERFAIAVSNNSGCTGAAISRRRFGETVKAINTSFPHWFCDNYKKYNDNEDALPIDQHMLIALIAPRPVYVASGAKDRWADPEGEFLGALNAGPAYELFGETGLGVDEWPAVNDPVGDYIGYHVRSGWHGLTDYDWLCYLDFADRHFEAGEE